MSEGLWDGEQRYVVYCLPMEEGLPKVHRLKIEIMQRIWGWGRTTAEPDCCSCTVSLPIFPPVMWCWGFFGCSFGAFFSFFLKKKSFVFQSEALVAKEKH